MINPFYLISGGFIFVLLALAAYYGRKQIIALRRLRYDDRISTDERRYVRNQSWIRLANSSLMVLLAGLLIGWFFMHDRFTQLEKRADEAKAKNEELVYNAEDRRFVRFCTYYWIAGLSVLLGMTILAGLDWWGIRKFGIRQYRQIQRDRRAMIEEEVARIRGQLNGRHG